MTSVDARCENCCIFFCPATIFSLLRWRSRKMQRCLALVVRLPETPSVRTVLSRRLNVVTHDNRTDTWHLTWETIWRISPWLTLMMMMIVPVYNCTGDFVIIMSFTGALMRSVLRYCQSRSQSSQKKRCMVKKNSKFFAARRWSHARTGILTLTVKLNYEHGTSMMS